jgi:hypothetical protein
MEVFVFLPSDTCGGGHIVFRKKMGGIAMTQYLISLACISVHGKNRRFVIYFSAK